MIIIIIIILTSNTMQLNAYKQKALFGLNGVKQIAQKSNMIKGINVQFHALMNEGWRRKYMCTCSSCDCPVPVCLPLASWQ